jgi:adenylate kinase
LDIPLDIALERLSQRSLDPVTGNRFHTHDQPAPRQDIKQRLTQHPTDEDEAVQKRFQTYSVYYDELQDYYSLQNAIHIPADQDAYTVFEAVEAGIVNPLDKYEN